MYTLVNNTSRLRARDKSAAINVPRISNMARIFARDALVRWSAPTIVRAINRSPGSPSLPSLIPMPKYPPPYPWHFSHVRGYTYEERSWCSHVRTHRQRFQFSRSRRKRSPRAQVSRGEDSRRRFPGESDAREYRFSAECEIAFGAFSLSRLVARFPSVAMVPSSLYRLRRWKRRRCSDTR